MKYRLLRRFSLLLLLIVGGVLAGQADVVTKWVKTNPSQLATNDVVVIVDETSSKAMANDKGTSGPPTATAVTLNNDKSAISSDVPANLQWTVTVGGDNPKTYKFSIGETDSLYCTNSNNGVRVGSNTNNAFTIENGFLKNSSTSRYIGVYNSQDWRCYTNTTGNISGTVTSFYKKTEVEESRTDITVTFPEESYKAVFGQAFSAPTASVNPAGYDGAVTYNSTNEQVATVNTSTGAVTLVGVGTTTINAVASETNTYQGGSASYTLTCMGVIEDGIFDFSLFNDYGSGFEFTKVGIHEGTWTAGNVSMYVEGRNGWYNSDYTLKLYGEVPANPEQNTDAQPAGKITLSVPQGYLISKIEFAGTAANMTANVGTYEAAIWTGASNSVAFTASGNVSFSSITVTYRSESQKETTVTLTGNYSVMGAIGESLALPTAVVEAEGQPINATVNWSSADPTIAAIENGMLSLKAKGTVTLTATFAGDNNNAASNATYSVKVAEAAYTNIPAMLAAITSTQTPVVYRFNNALVTYAKNSNVYISDGTNGFMLYVPNLGLTAGDNVTGELYGNLYTYNELPEISLKTNDISFTKNSTGNAVEPATITIDQLSANVNKYIKIEHATFVSVNNKDIAFKVGEENLAAYNQWNIATADLTADQNYTIIAMGSVKNETYQIYPISFELEAAAEPVFRDIKADLTQLQNLATESNVYITVAENGAISQTDNAANAAATLKGKWHGTSYGWSNFTASVPVTGCVKITYATHDYGNEITVTNDAQEVVAKLNTTGEKWSNSHDNVVVAYYRVNQPTTLHFSNANYNPYFAVEAIDEADLPAEITNYNVTFAAGDGTGVAPAALEVAAGSAFQAPRNYSLYKEGATLTGWSDGTTTYAVGTEITPAADMALTAVYTANTVSLADRTAAVTINYELGGYNDNPKYKFEGNSGIIVAQANVGGKDIDVKVDIDATSGKFSHNGSGWHQVNTGTKVTVPSCKDAVITVTTYQNANTLKFGETAATADNAPATFTATADDASLIIEQTGNGYWNKLSITLPAPQSGGGDEPVEPAHDPIVQTWDYTEENIPTTSPADGLYFASYVNDAAGTNNGLHGVKLNSTGYAYFAKEAVTGKLTLSIGMRSGADAYAVNVYACTIDNGTATKGALIGEVAVDASPGTGSIEIPADVTGIYIERKTPSEGVLQKVLFKETVARNFTDFEITNIHLKGQFDASTLPAGVTFSGTQRNDDHGYGNVTITVPVDGTVKFTIGGCRYANPTNCRITNKNGDLLAEPNLKTATCYHEDDAAVTYFYIGEPTTLTFTNIAYLPYFKAEATEVSEAVITFRDQNNQTIGTKTVFEGDPVGEIAYSEADLTIPAGEKFRGWTYANGIKVKATDIVTGNVTIKASVTPVESVAVGSVQTYDLTNATFYPEDHETCSATNGTYYNNHGFTFNAGGSFSVDVAGKAQIVLTLCQYGNGTTIQVTDAQNNVVKADVPAVAANDGGITTVNYDGPATTLTMTFAEQTYLHMVTVYNVTGFMEKDASGYYIVPAGDAASLLMAINSASSEEGAKIFLPDGTYDLGEAAKTGIAGKNVSLIGQSAEKTIIVNHPKEEGLDKADLLKNTGEGLYMQDISLKNDYAYGGNNGRAASLHDMGTKTICKNVFLLSHQDTYYSHKVGGLYYFEGGELHGTVDYLCGNGKAYFNACKLVNEQRSTATIVANSELYVFNNCTVENNANSYNLGRAWSDQPVCIYLNTTLLDPNRLISTRWNLSGINCDFRIAGEYGTKNANGQDITPASNNVTFTKQNRMMNTILSEEQAATYTIDYVLGDWANTAQAACQQVAAPADAQFTNGNVTWTAVEGATAYALFKNDELVGITTGTAFDVTAQTDDVLTIRSANTRGGFGQPATVGNGTTGIDRVNKQEGETVYNLQGQRIGKAQKGVNIINGNKVVVK